MPQLVYAAEDLAGNGLLFRDLFLDGNPCPARLAVFGDPVAHSKSPQMHNAALKKQRKPLQYVRIQVAADQLEGALRNLEPAGFLGTNLTIPHKQAALEFMDEITPESRLMGAINTVALCEGKLHGYNTDGPGFAAAVNESFGVELGTLRVLILGGGGGAGRAITVQCALAGCPTIFVANRTLEKAQLLSEEIEENLEKSITPIRLSPAALENSTSCVDLIVNATSRGMKEADPSPLPDGILSKDHLVYDTVYSGGTTALTRQAQAASSKYANGLSMLIHQGALAYEIWFNEPAPLETMRTALEEAVRE